MLRSCKICFTLAALAVLGLAALQPASAQKYYWIRDLGTLPEDTESHASAINNLGHVCGTSAKYTENSYALEAAVLWRGKTITLLEGSDRQNDIDHVTAINDAD